MVPLSFGKSRMAHRGLYGLSQHDGLHVEKLTFSDMTYAPSKIRPFKWDFLQVPVKQSHLQSVPGLGEGGGACHNMSCRLNT